MSSLHEKLINVQSELKAPKSRKNSFANYSYRNCEDILEAVKPLLKEHGLNLTVSDEIVQVGDRYYVKATASVGIIGTPEQVHVSAFAREPEEKKGSDASQITGAASSYARKYALNGLFLIDDNQDADSQDNREQPKAKPKPVPLASETQLSRIDNFARSLGIENVYEKAKTTRETLTASGADIIIERLQKNLESAMDETAKLNS